MFYNFESVHIQGFQSIDNETIDLSRQGTVLVIGTNESESKAISNGSGKSSIFESIRWCIYGSTSAGISNPKNRYTNSGCLVELNVRIDGIHYLIRRSIDHIQYGTVVQLIKESVDISGRNKTDTNKMIQNDIFNIGEDIFSSIIFLSQGFNSKITNLGPSAIKDRLEKLSDTSSKIEYLKGIIYNLNKEYDAKDRSKSNELSTYEGQKTIIESDIRHLTDSIVNNSKLCNSDIPNIEILQDTYNKLQSTKTVRDGELYKSRSELTSYKNELNSLQRSLSNISSEIEKLSRDSQSINSNKCYVCGSSLNEETKDQLQKKFELDIREANDKKSNIENDINTIKDLIDSKISEVNACEHIVQNLDSEISKIVGTINKYSSYRDISKDKEDLLSKKSQLIDINKNITDLSKELESIQDYKHVTDHCLSLITKQFRTYMLNNIVRFLNERLKIYSKMLFVDSIIEFNEKLNITCNGYEYATFSGGEKRKIDIALVFAQRDLALNVSGFSSNLIIVDEIFDNLDSTAISIVSEMISYIATDIDSTYVISHVDTTELRYDYVLNIIKNKDKISHINIR